MEYSNNPKKESFPVELSEEDKKELLIEKQIDEAIEKKIVEEEEEDRKKEEELREKENLKKLEKARKTWSAYKSIETDLLKIIEYIPLETRQYELFSFKLGDIIIRCCTQIEAIFKDLIRERLFLENLGDEKYKELKTKVDKNKTNILDFMESFRKSLVLTNSIFSLRSNGDRFSPFDMYLEGGNKKIPFWWSINNKLKHDFSKNLEMANLRVAICALGSLFILNCKLPNNHQNLILKGVLSSPNFLHIGHFLNYIEQEEKIKKYNVLAQTDIFEFWLYYNENTMGMTLAPSISVGEF
jgi:hypothetical protein